MPILFKRDKSYVHTKTSTFEEPCQWLIYMTPFQFESKNNSKAILISLCLHKPTPRTTLGLWSSYSSQFLRPSVGGRNTSFCCPVPTLEHILASLLSKFALSTPSRIGKAWQRKAIQHFCYLTLRFPFSKAPSSYQIWKTEYLTKQPPHLPIKSELPSVTVVDAFRRRIC